MTLEEQARQAIGEPTLDHRTLEIINARVLLIIRAAIALEREAFLPLVETARQLAECSTTVNRDALRGALVQHYRRVASPVEDRCG